MNIPEYWAKATEVVSQNRGRTLDLSAWGWSSEGQAEAEAHARRRLSTMIEKVEAGEELARGYGYGNRPLREEIVEILDTTEDGAAVVTRNVYGCLVLNAQSALFLDVDLPKRTLADRLRGLLGRAGSSPEARVLDRLEELLRQVRGASFRIYRTAAGFRVLGTDPAFPQGDRTATELLADPVVDSAYAKLCGVQQSYRARLTPKPWRCGCERPPARFPFASESERVRHSGWLEEYERASAAKATCALVREVGWGRVSSEIAAVLELHDRTTRVGSDLPLA